MRWIGQGNIFFGNYAMLYSGGHTAKRGVEWKINCEIVCLKYNVLTIVSCIGV